MKSRIFSMIIALVSALCLTTAVAAGDITAGSHYFKDAQGKTIFLAGFYNWASTVPGYCLGNPATYADMYNSMGQHGGNYMRLSLGINTFSSSTNPKSCNGKQTPIPFELVGAKANLDQINQTYFDALKTHVQTAQQKGVMVHVCFFDGVDLRGGGEAYRWAGSFYNIDNQTKNFYGDLDQNNNGSADQNGDFYRTADFKNNTGVGKYQRIIIDKAIGTIDQFDNVFYEVGNELFGAPSDWFDAVIAYAKTKTNKAVTTNGHTVPSANYNMGIATHQGMPGKPGNFRKNYPYWPDPDNGTDGSMDPNRYRQCAWYSLVSGAAGWGGFTTATRQDPIPTERLKMDGYLLKFLSDNNVDIAKLEPNHSLVSNAGQNGCLSDKKSTWLCYVKADASVTLDLSGASGNLSGQALDTDGGATKSITVEGGGTKTISRPSGITSDWALVVKTGEAVQSRRNSASIRWYEGAELQSVKNGIRTQIPAGTSASIYSINGSCIAIVKGDMGATFRTIKLASGNYLLALRSKRHNLQKAIPIMVSATAPIKR